MFKNLLSGAVAVVFLWTTAAGADDPPAGTDLQIGPVRVRVLAQPEEVADEAVRVQAGPVRVHVGPQPIRLSDYWIGLQCHPARGALGSQLGLPDGQGLIVDNVLPDSPAAKAGVRRHDVLVTAGEVPLKDVPDLGEAIEKAATDKTGAKQLTLGLIRDGKPQKIALTPEKRPAEARTHIHHPGPVRGDWNRVWDWVENIRPGVGGRGPMRLRFFGPGAILPPDAPLLPPLPKNMSVTITRQGDEPARIVVKRDGQKWEVTEEELDKLPENIRPHVERMLGRLPGSDFKVFEPGPEWPHPPQIKPEDFTPQFELPPGRLEQRLEKRVEEMNRRMEELRKSIDELHQKRQQPKAPKKNPPDKM